LASLHPKPQHKRLGLKPSYQQEMNEEEDHSTILSLPPYLLFSLPQQQKKRGKKALKSIQEKNKSFNKQYAFHQYPTATLESFSLQFSRIPEEKDNTKVSKTAHTYTHIRARAR
jgi:hypothetical protein